MALHIAVKTAVANAAPGLRSGGKYTSVAHRLVSGSARCARPLDAHSFQVPDAPRRAPPRPWFLLSGFPSTLNTGTSNCASNLPAEVGPAALMRQMISW